MKRLSFRFGRTAFQANQTASVSKWSPAKAWALGLGSLGGVALLALNWGTLGSHYSPISADEQAVGLSDSDGSLAHAFYSAGLTQEMGTFGALHGVGAAKTSSDGSAGGLFSSPQATGATLLYTGGGMSAVGASHVAYALGDISAARQFAGGSSAAFAASHAAGGSGGGGYGGGGGNSGRGSGGSAAGGGSGASAGSADSATGEGVSGSASVSDEGGKAVALALAADSAPQSFPFTEEAALAAVGRAEGAELILAKGVDEAGESLALVQAAVPDDPDARVPDLASTWALLAVAFAGLTVLRRVPA